MKWIASSVAAGVLAVGAMPAFAGGAVMTAPPTPAPAVKPAPAMTMGSNWTGFSAGLNLGYANVSYAGSSGSGATYGIQGAYDHDFGSWVLGGTVSYDWANIGVGNDKLVRLGRVGLRSGVDLGNTFLYATGGAAWGELQPTGSNTYMSDTGWFAGVGAEYRIVDNWTVSGELLTNQFSNFHSSGSSLSATTLSVDVNYRF